MTNLDKFNRLSGTVDPTLAAGGVPQDLDPATAAAGLLSTNWLDYALVHENLGEGTPLFAEFLIASENVAAATANLTVRFQIIASPRTTLTALTFNSTSDVDDATETITIAAHGLTDGTLITVSGTPPTGLSASTHYYIINATTNTFQVAATPGGAAINLTDAVGTCTLTFYPTVIGDSAEVPFERLLIGDRVSVRLNPPHQSDYLPIHRYVFARYLPSADLTAGMAFCDIVPGHQGGQFYGPSGFSVSD